MVHSRKSLSRRAADNETEVLIKSAALASRTAIRESKALGLTIKLISGDKIIEKDPDGTKRVLRKLEREQSSLKGLKKGMILRRK